MDRQTISRKSDNVCYCANDYIAIVETVTTNEIGAEFAQARVYKKEKSEAHWLSAVLVLIIIINANCFAASQDTYYVGKRFPSERKTYKDPVTGYEISMLTTSPAKDNKIYQTHPNWTADGRHIVFTSDRTGTKQYFALSVDTGVITQLTNDTGPGNAFVLRNSSSMFYISQRTIWKLDINTILDLKGNKQNNRFTRKIAGLPPKLTVSGTLTVDSNGKDIYIGVQYNEDSWGLLALNADTGKFRKIIDLDFRVGHCQAHPSIPGLIMYCWETGGDSQQRMWIVRADGSDNGPFYKETYDEWVTHEVWWGPDKALFTIWPKDERMLKKPHGIAYITLKNRSLNILSQKKYWHVGGSPDGRWAAGDNFNGEIYLISAGIGEAKLLTQGHRPRGTTVHPHPSFSPDGSSILFCSEKNGNWDLFLVQANQ
jgi:oligogalacturonide lyase